MTAEVLSGIAGALLSVLFSYTPGLRRWFDHLGAGDAEAGIEEDGGARKRLVMLGLLVLSAGAIFAGSCAGLPFETPTIACDRAGLLELARILGMAIIANQSIYAISPRPGRRGQAAAPPDPQSLRPLRPRHVSERRGRL